MTKILLILIAIATLAGCATPQRQGPPAPVVSASQPRPAPVEPPPSPAAPKKAGPAPVQVYAYRPPSEAARIPEPTPAPAEAADAPSDTLASAESAQDQSTPPARVEPGQRQAVPAGAAAVQPPATRPKPEPRPEPAAPPAPEAVASAPASQGQASPADALRVQAEQQRQSGDFAGAAATLERALRIQPQDPRLWNRLARVRMDQGLHSQAANLAARSNALAGDQSNLRQDNWSIIAAARRQAGDAAGAEEAERKARGA